MKFCSWKVRKEMTRLGLTTKEFAELIGVKPLKLCYALCYKKVCKDVVEACAAEMNVKAEDLIGR